MEKRMFNGHCNNPLDFNNNFTAFDTSRCAMSSLYNPSKLFPLSTPPLPSMPLSTPSSSSSSSPRVGVDVGDGGSNNIEHPVTKFDTLAGLAIKYGVEAAAIKKLNGLVTDHQMFARKTIQIPLDGRHPPNDQDASENHRVQKPLRHCKSVTFDTLDSFKLGSSSLLNVPPAMTSQRRSCGLELAIEKSNAASLEMYLKQGANYSENGLAPTPPLSQHRKCKSVTHDLHAKYMLANNGEAQPPETILKPEFIGGSGFSPVGDEASKGLALRAKSFARTASGSDNEGGFPVGLGNSAQPDVFRVVRRTCSTPSLQDGRCTAQSYLFGFDGLPNPKTGKKSKAG